MLHWAIIEVDTRISYSKHFMFYFWLDAIGFHRNKGQNNNLKQNHRSSLKEEESLKRIEGLRILQNFCESLSTVLKG